MTIARRLCYKKFLYPSRVYCSCINHIVKVLLEARVKEPLQCDFKKIKKKLQAGDEQA